RSRTPAIRSFLLAITHDRRRADPGARSQCSSCDGRVARRAGDRAQRRRAPAVPKRLSGRSGRITAKQFRLYAGRSLWSWLPAWLARAQGQSARRSGERCGSAQTLLDASNNHRILRRGRKFGGPVDDRYRDDQQERGLLFMCLNSDIARQFEFVQQTWILNRNFATLLDETDPLVGPKGPFTVREQPLRRIVEVETFV